jgi:hypothetical protein
VSLALADRPAESLAVYEDLCARPQAPLEAHLGRSRVLIALNRAGEACEVLEGVRDRFWGRPEFLLALMGAAYAADREDLAGLALRHLAELQAEKAEGEKTGGQFLQTKTLDELKAYLLEQREFHEGLQWQVLRGTLPWLIVEPHPGDIPYFGWARRTQPLPWVYEDPLVWAGHNVYATNGFTVVKPTGGRASLVPISWTDQTRIAADMTALITLHQLGLIGRFGDRFREILVLLSTSPMRWRNGLACSPTSCRAGTRRSCLARRSSKERCWCGNSTKALPCSRSPGSWSTAWSRKTATCTG